MKHVKIVLASIFLFIGPLTFFAEENIRLHLPVRILNGQQDLTQLNKENFLLFVNGKEREIVDLIKKEKSIGKAPSMGRNFILSFHINENPEIVMEGISYFVTQILNPTDYLIILTPIKAYRITLSENKLKIISMIEELIKSDCKEFYMKRAAYEKNLKDKIKKLKIRLLNFKRDPYLIRSYKDANQFLYTFPKELDTFKKNYLTPDINKFRQILSLLGTREGERWWIDFQQREVSSLLSQTSEIIKILNEYISYFDRGRSSLARGMRLNLNNLENQMAIAKSFPDEQLLNVFIGGNFNYNCIFCGNLKGNDSMGGQVFRSDIMGGILEKISRESGGKTVRTINPEQGLRKIEKHRDHYYQLSYDFNGSIEEKKIRVILKDKKIGIIYKPNFGKQEVNSLIKYHSEEKVKIENVSIYRNKVSFTTKVFKLKPGKDGEYGILRVWIDMFDKKGSTLYKTEKTLRINKRRTNISVSLPWKYQGVFKLSISAYDLIANSFISIWRTITIK